MASRTLEVQIVGDSKSLENALGRSAKSAETSFQKIGKASLGAGAAITAGVVVGLTKSVQAAEDAQRVQAQTESQLKALGISYADHAKQIENVIDKTSKLAAVDDEELQTSFNQLVRTTGNVGKALKDAALAADIARGKNISLEAATMLVTKAELGKAGALTRAGIAVDANATKVELLDTLQRKFAGSAKAYGETAAGSQERMRVAVENLEESLGSLLLPMVERVANAMSRLADFFTEHETLAKALVIAIGALGTVMLTVGAAMKIWGATQAVITAATAAWTAAQWLLNAALTANPIGVVVVALAALVAGIVLAWRQSETFRNIVTGAFNAVKSAANAVLDFFRNNWKIIALLISGPFAPLVALATNAFGIRSAIVNAANAILDFFRSNWKTIAVLISGPFAPLVALATNAFGIRDAMIGAFNAIKERVANAINGIIDLLRWLANNAGKLMQKMTDAITAPINAAVALFQRLLDIIGAVRSAVDAVLDKIANIHIPKLPHIPGFASGVQNFGGGFAMVGERGPELVHLPPGSDVIPMSQGAGVSGAGGGSNITINLPNYLGRPEEVAQVLRDELLRMQRRGISLGFT